MCCAGDIISIRSIGTNTRPGKYIFLGMKSAVIGDRLCYCAEIKEILRPQQIMNVFF